MENRMSGKIAVVGAGIYGVTIALKLSESFDIDLFESSNDILMAASGINQYRLHRGYHYPRSDKTAKEALESEKPFIEFYKEAIISDNEHYYLVAKEGSRTSREEFINFCLKHGLEHNEEKLELVNPEKIALITKTKESLIDPYKMREICWKRINEAKINVLLNTPFSKQDLNKYDKVINCTYSNLNFIIDPNNHMEYKFQLCEKPVVSLPKWFNKKSMVVVDGPFMCIDPLGSTGNFVMGNVIHAIHSMNVGKFPNIDPVFLPLLNRGIIKNPPITNFNKFIESCAEFIPEVKHAKHIGSMFTIRAVHAGVEETDERLITITKENDKIINVFAGKLSGCVLAANKVYDLLIKEIPIQLKTN